MKKLREASAKVEVENSENCELNSAMQAVEQDFEEEVLHECFETSGSSSLGNQVHQEWRVASKASQGSGHFRQYSR